VTKNPDKALIAELIAALDEITICPTCDGCGTWVAGSPCPQCDGSRREFYGSARAKRLVNKYCVKKGKATNENNKTP
jgi:DnaJ-class molecular chaperone